MTMAVFQKLSCWLPTSALYVSELELNMNSWETDLMQPTIHLISELSLQLANCKAIDTIFS